jgi:hypothetical protein
MLARFGAFFSAAISAALDGFLLQQLEFMMITHGVVDVYTCIRRLSSWCRPLNLEVDPWLHNMRDLKQFVRVYPCSQSSRVALLGCLLLVLMHIVVMIGTFVGQAYAVISCWISTGVGLIVVVWNSLKS